MPPFSRLWGEKERQSLYNDAVMATFSALNLSKTMVETLKKQGYVEPSPIQLSIIPRALRGESLVVQSPTGSGKTHAYLIPLIEKVDQNLPRLQSIIIAPSRELARQVYEFAKPFQKTYQKLKIRLLTSEAEKTDNTSGLSFSAPQIVIGTPGRLKDILINDYSLDLHGVKSLVLDEADMLMEFGYFEDIDAIYQKLTSEPQTMVFSATLHEGLKENLRRYIKSDFTFEGGDSRTAAEVKHHLVDIKHCGPYEALKRFLKIRNPYLCLVFCSKKEDVKKTFEALRADNYACEMFSGDLSQRERRAAIRRIKENRYQIIVASDLLSRGIDLEDVTDVISMDLPSELEYYHHRAGRTGRFGKKGDSWVFYNADSTKRPLLLMKEGIPFEFMTLKEDRLEIDPVGLAPKKKLTKKKTFSEEEQRDVKIAKANARSKKVKPGYKKKVQWEVERVKNKYRRKAIQKSINKSRAKKMAEEARKGSDE